jgi:hypothetical protein
MQISENAGYRQYCECTPVQGLNYVRIFTTYDWAKDPNQEQNKIELFLTDAQLELFKASLK